ncbi:FKBP-type peptidyl-prolyl cis-trans isomerase [Phenylobacterium sp.]|uniref:FKBP-type peptidyl-prolyl cis-trans isomerase n=1 Tax=Phenylobacterium sp. TaxID=1871053 RepID=UPI002F3EAE33
MTGPLALCAALTLLAAAAPAVAQTPGKAGGGKTVTLPGLSYQVLGSGPAGGAHPKRSDTVQMRYVGKLTDGEVFSTSPDEGKGLSTFPVGQLIPGMNAALQLMRPGDHWVITMPPYLAYGPGRPLNTPPPSAAAAGQTVQHRGIPPNATLVFEVWLEAIAPPKAP